MKYRRLTLEELNSLEKEFVDFLVINSITADDWVKIKEESPEKAERVIELFSDFVFDGILRKAHFMAFKGTKELYAWQCLEDRMVLVGLKATPDSNVDFTDQEYINKVIRNPDKSLRIFTTEKKYAKPREQELFDMLEKGCEITDGRIFKVLCLAL